MPRKAYWRRSDAKGLVLADKIHYIVEADPSTIGQCDPSPTSSG
jgi:hypothetical protein